MKYNTIKDSSSLNSTIKTNSSSKNEDIFSKQRPRGGIKSKINNFQPGRHTVAVPLNSFSGISHNASFQSKLKFFNNGKPTQKFQHVPLAHDKVISEDNDKKDNTNIKKIGQNKDDKNKKIKTEKDDIDCNMNINKIIESKNSNSNNSNNINNTNNTNKNNDFDNKTKKNYMKKNTMSYSQKQIHELNLDKNLKSLGNNEKKTDDKKPSSTNLKLKSLKDQWDFQKILLDYNILDFTSKLKIFNFL